MSTKETVADETGPVEESGLDNENGLDDENESDKETGSDDENAPDSETGLDSETTPDDDTGLDSETGSGKDQEPDGLPPAKKTRLREFRGGVMLFAFIPLSVAYMEILLRLLCGYGFWQGLHIALLFSLSVGFFVSAIALAIPKPKISRIVAGILLGIICFVVALEYFMYTTYRVFMNFDTILFGAGQVMGGFSDVFITALTNGLPAIIGFFLPLVLFFLLTRKPYPYAADEKRPRAKLVMSHALMLGIAIMGQVISMTVSSSDKAAYSTEYNFDSSSRRLGILMGLGLDIRYGIFGNPSTDAFFVMEELVREPWTPSTPARPPTSQPSATPGYAPASTNTVQDPVEPPPPPIEYGYNMADIDFETLISNERNSRIRSVHEYVASIPASKQNEHTGIFEGKNLILITAEAFTKQVVDPIMTPTLYRLVNNGFYFSDYYQPAWGGSTSSGEYSVLTGLAPVSGARSILMAANQNLSYTIGNKLMDLGYYSAAYHNGSHTYYHRNRTHTYFGYSSFIAWGSGMEGHVQIKWPISDLEMMEFSLPHYIDNQPFSIYYMTVSGHCLYTRSGNAMSAKNWDAFPEQYSEMSSFIRAYMACNLELEYALEYLVSQLEAAGIADDTVIALSTDHYPYGLERSESWKTDRDYLSELFGFTVRTPADRDHNALIIWSGSLENEHKELAVEISSPTFSLDILPTLLNLFGLEFDSRLFAGRDVFSDAAPLVFWLNRSWVTDLGFFNASRNEFTPSTDMEIPHDYIDRVRNIVNNRINYSDAVTAYDYFNTLFNPDGTVRPQE